MNTLTEDVAAIAAGRTTARELADAQLARIRDTDPRVHAWAHLDPAYVRQIADDVDRLAGEGPLRGIGVGIKDIIDTAALPTEIGTVIHRGRRPERSAACIARLEAAGAYAFGKTVTTAFAYLDPGPTRNPWNLGHTPGGSSCGSAAAVAAGHVEVALGTQTNGSVIRPAAFCGVIGFKPTYGLVDFTGAHLFSATFDTLGTFTRTVADAALVASVLAPVGAIAPGVARLARPPRLALLPAFPWADVTRAMTDSLAEAGVRLRSAGATVAPVPFPEAWRDAHRLHRTIMLYEGARALGALQSAHRGELTAQVNAALDEGHGIAEEDYRAALAARAQAIAYFTDWLAEYDAVLSPPALGAAPAGIATTGDPACCTLWSLIGFPAINLPIGFDPQGLPLGLQLVARANADDALLAVAAWCESHLGFGARIAQP